MKQTMYLAASRITEKVDDAFLWIGGICLVLLVGITLMMVVFVIKYHRKRNPKATQIHGNTPLEVTWIVIPTLIVLFMFYKGYEGFKLMREPPGDAKVINVLAQKWFWTFSYPDEKISSDRLVVPIRQPIKLHLTSPPEDVVHSFYLPAFRVKEDCVPGRQNYLWFEADKLGMYNIFCAEFCGKDHSKMITSLEVLSREDYDAWVRQKIMDRNKPIDIEAAMDPGSEEIEKRNGAKLFETYCISCHGRGGEGGLVEGARDFRKLEGWKQGNKLVDIYRTLEKGVEGTQMRSFNNLPRWDRFALMHHVASFYKGDDRPESTPEDIGKLVEEYRLDEQVEIKDRISIEKAMEAIARER